MQHDDDYDHDDADRGPSRGQLKREAEELQRLGEALVALPPERLAEIPLPETLADAVRLAQRISAHGGRRRQLQLIGKLMRSEDPAPIRAALEKIENRSALGTAAHHRAERWRERLLDEGDDAATEFLQAFPDTDRQRLRQLVRAAQHERAAGKPPKSARELFRLVRDALSANE